MKTSKILRCWVLVGLCVMSGACGRRGPTQREWTEDVLLKGGTTVQVHRTVKLNVSNSVSGDAYNAVELAATLSFLGPLKNLPSWSAPRMALVLYRDPSTMEWVIVSTSTSCEIWERSGKPKPNYWEYRLTSEGWKEVSLSRASIGRKANLFRSYDHKMKSDHITVAERERLDGDPLTLRKYREIWGDPDMYICGEGNSGKRL